MKFKEDESATKLRGGYYTPPEIADLLLRWVLAISPGRLLEPSCGDGVFLAALVRRGAMAADTGVTAFEIDPAEAAKARDVSLPGSVVHTCDFLGWSAERLAGAPLFDAVVGNPPFIRYQYLDPGAQEVAARIFRAFGLPFTRHTNAWVPFVIASLALLRPGGRLAMVLPAELLHVLHAQPLRTFLSARCSRVLVFDPQELWFEGTLQGAVLVLAETRTGPASRGEGVAIVPTRGAALLRQEPDEVFGAAAYVNGPALAGKWMPALLSRRERDLLEEAARRPAVRRLGELAEVDIGIVTGANKFFLVPDAVVERHGLAPWAFPMFGRSEHVPGVVYDEAVHAANRRAGLPGHFLWFDGGGDLPGRVRAYLAAGEAAGLPRRYKCRIRQPWYRVPSVYATPVGMLKRSHHFPRLIRNRLGAFTTDTAYRLRPRVEPDALVASFVNSLTALCAELEGRHYGGGVLELVPSEIEKLLVPFPAAASGEPELRNLDRAVRDGLAPGELLARQDAAVLAPAGLTPGEAEELRGAWARLRVRRQRTDS